MIPFLLSGTEAFLMSQGKTWETNGKMLGKLAKQGKTLVHYSEYRESNISLKIMNPR